MLNVYLEGNLIFEIKNGGPHNSFKQKETLNIPHNSMNLLPFKNMFCSAMYYLTDLNMTSVCHTS